MRTFNELKREVMSALPASMRPPSKEEMEQAINGAIASVHGEMYTPLAPSTLIAATGTSQYSIPDNVAYIDEVRDSTGKRIPHYAWELGMGTTPTIHFRSPYFEPTTGKDPKLYGGRVQLALSAGSDQLLIDPGYIVYRAVATLYGNRGMADPGFAETAEARLADEVLMAKYRPKPYARLVPGRTSSAGTPLAPLGLGGYIIAAVDTPDHVKQYAHVVCDGVDDQEEIQAALDTTKVVVLCEGIFRTSAQISLNDCNHLRGAGMRATTIKPADAASTFDVIGGSSSGDGRNDYAQLSDMYVHGNRQNVTSGYCINLSRLHIFSMEHIYADYGKSGGIFCDNTVAGVEYLNAYDVIVDNPLNGTDAWHMRLTFVRLVNCVALHANNSNGSSGRGFWCRGSHWTVTNCFSDHGTEYTGYGFVGENLENSVFSNCHTYKSCPVAFNQVGFCANVAFIGCWAHKAKKYAFAVQPDGSDPSLYKGVHGARIIGCGVGEMVEFEGHKDSFRGIQTNPGDTLVDSIIAYNYFPEPLSWGDITYTDCIRYPQTGQKLENQASTTRTGNGSTTTFTIPHALDQVPTWVTVVAGSADAEGDFYVSGLDGTNITIEYKTAPPGNGANNLTFYWRAAKV